MSVFNYNNNVSEDWLNIHDEDWPEKFKEEMQVENFICESIVKSIICFMFDWSDVCGNVTKYGFYKYLNWVILNEIVFEMELDLR